MNETQALIEADKKHGWHPFTQMRDWCAPGHEPLVLVSGGHRGAHLHDGILADVAPTICQLLGIDPPPSTTGRTLIEG